MPVRHPYDTHRTCPIGVLIEKPILSDSDMVGTRLRHGDGAPDTTLGTRVVHDVREMTHSHVNPSNVIRREHDTSD
ncbi:hypothetical protein JHK85_028191 [Glycine max]|nr:hypothetical protein JHK85_028191 [Glycine max]